MTKPVLRCQKHIQTEFFYVTLLALFIFAQQQIVPQEKSYQQNARTAPLAVDGVYRLYYPVTLHNAPDFLAEHETHRMLIYERGLEIIIKKIGQKATDDAQPGQWAFAELADGGWTVDGEWLKKGFAAWIFLYRD